MRGELPVGLQGRDWGLLPASLPPPAMGQQLSVCLSVPRTEPGAGDRAVNETGPIPAVLEVTVHEGQDPAQCKSLGIAAGLRALEEGSWHCGAGYGGMEGQVSLTPFCLHPPTPVTTTTTTTITSTTVIVSSPSSSSSAVSPMSPGGHHVLYDEVLWTRPHFPPSPPPPEAGTTIFPSQEGKLSSGR